MSSRLEDPRWSAVRALVVSAVVAVAVLASLAALLAFLSETSSGPESSLSLVFVAAAVVLILVVCTLTIVLKRLRLTNPEEPMGLPRGSIRAVIALLLILLFFIAAIFLFNSTLLGGERDQNRSLEGIDSARYSAIPTDQIVTASSRTVGTQTVYDVVLYPSSSGTPTSDDLAKQLVTTLATLVTAVAAFYFGANSVRGAVKDAATPPLSGAPDKVSTDPGSQDKSPSPSVDDTEHGVPLTGPTGIPAENAAGQPESTSTDDEPPSAAQTESTDHQSALTGTKAEGGSPMSDFDTRPGDEIQPMGEADGDALIGPDLDEEDVVVDDIHERNPTEQG